MSGSCDNSDCPRCLGKDTLQVNSNWRPFDTTTGMCFRCGFTYDYVFSLLNPKEYAEEIKEFENPELEKETQRELTKEELKQIKEFDKNYGVKL